MTPDEKLEELNISIYCSDSNSDISSLTDNLPTINANMLHQPKIIDETPPVLNFKDSFAARCADKIIQHEDMHIARERIKKRQDEG